MPGPGVELLAPDIAAWKGVVTPADWEVRCWDDVDAGCVFGDEVANAVGVCAVAAGAMASAGPVPGRDAGEEDVEEAPLFVEAPLWYQSCQAMTRRLKSRRIPKIGHA